MKQGELVKRGVFSTGRPNNSYLDEVREKFKAPKSEFKLEEFLKEITPRNHVKKAGVLEFMKSKVKKLRDLGRWEEAAAWEHWHSEMQVRSFESKIDVEFTSDFQAWLLGMGKELDHQRTPWYKFRCRDKECEAYLGSLLGAKYEFINELNMLMAKSKLSGLVGIKEFYLFFKYIVRGGWENIEAADFMYDWNRLIKDVDTSADQNQTTQSDVFDRLNKGLVPVFNSLKSNLVDFDKAIKDVTNYANSASKLFSTPIVTPNPVHPAIDIDDEKLDRNIITLNGDVKMDTTNIEKAINDQTSELKKELGLVKTEIKNSADVSDVIAKKMTLLNKNTKKQLEKYNETHDIIKETLKEQQLQTQ